MDSYNGKETFLQADKRSCKSFEKKCSGLLSEQLKIITSNLIRENKIKINKQGSNCGAFHCKKV